MRNLPRPSGSITRGTTHTNRLRRVDRWLVHEATPLLRRARHPVVVDLGFGAVPTTAIELTARLRRQVPSVHVWATDIDPERVARAQGYLRHHPRDGLTVVRSGFELTGVPGPVHVVRAANVLRQYDVTEVAPAWRQLSGHLADGGVIVDATCDEIGRVSSWVCLQGAEPVSLTMSLHLASLECPTIIATRLPKVLIHHNVPGQPVHRFIQEMAAQWARHRAVGAFGAGQRWLAMCQGLREQGWPVALAPRRWRLGELTVAWAAVAPK